MTKTKQVNKKNELLSQIKQDVDEIRKTKIVFNKFYFSSFTLLKEFLFSQLFFFSKISKIFLN